MVSESEREREMADAEFDGTVVYVWRKCAAARVSMFSH